MIITKAHGLGNDFIITDDRENNFSGDLSALAKKLCHRRTGIGADGLILCAKATAATCACRYSTAMAARLKCAATA